MAVNKFNSKDGYSIADPPIALIDNTGNYNTTTGSITAVNGTYTGDVSAMHFMGDFIGELQVECKNTSGSIIPKGTPVYITGTVGATNVLEVSPANANSSSTMPAVGLTSTEILVGATGHVTIMGGVQNLNTNSYTVGQTVYVAVGGGLTNVKPTGATELIQNIGRVGRVNQNNGEIIVTGAGRTNDVPNTISISGPLTVGDNLTVNGTTTTINSTITTLGPSTSGNTYLTIDSNLGESILAGENLAAIIGNAGISLVDYGGGITLDSSTGFSIGDVSGATSGEYLFIDPSGYTANFNGINVIAPQVSAPTFTSTLAGVDISYGFTASTTTTATTQINLAQLEKTTYRGAKFIIQAVNTTGGKYQFTEINAIHNGNTTVSTATISDINIGGANATYVVDIGGTGNTRMRLRATPTSTQSTVFKVYIRNFSI